MATQGEVSAALTLAKKVAGTGNGSVQPEYWLTGEGLAVRTGKLEALGCEFSEPISGLGDEPVKVDPKALGKALKEWKAAEEIEATVEDGRLVMAGVVLPDVATDNEWGEWTDPEFSGATFYHPNTVGKVCEFASTDEARPVLTGIHFESEGIVATDSYRLGVMPACGCDAEGGVTVPGKVVKAFCSVARTDSEAKFHLRWSDTEMVEVSVESKKGTTFTWTGRSIEGQFPNYRQLIPDSWVATATVDPDEAIPHLEKCARWAADTRAALRMQLNGNVQALVEVRDGVSVKAAPIAGEVKWHEGDGTDEMEVGVNPEFLLSAVKFAGEGAEVKVISPLRPILVENAGEFTSVKALVMPIRLNN